MRNISDIVFKPATGDNYGARSQFEMGVLIVGESHYADWGEPQDEAEWTRAALKKGCSKLKGESQFWRIIPQTVTGSTITLDSLNAFWSQVALYNYFQHPVTSANPATIAVGRRYRPQFLEVLSNLRPKLVLVFSVKAWWAMPPGDVEVSGSENDVGLDTTLYNANSEQQSLAVKLKHPRSGLSPTLWHPFVTKALTAARELPSSAVGERAL